ncbi:MAG: elongation factor P maturation arginine rhamnosyltransferase EarP [Betaproteobacteria bacterium]|nr:elongation factor P maturation arginine rhamnosyltransferase EarP [Betaproteobacteria bacterium]
MRWDIFCRVVDNFGDAGVTWRLARQLHSELDAEVRLFIDHLPTLARLDHRIDTESAEQSLSGVKVCHWVNDLVVGRIADVVLETFACDTPEPYLEAMAQQAPPPIWINLEYLSAEDWVGRCHRLPSPHPRFPLIRYFFFPGFDDQTGGLLRESGLLAERDAFKASLETRQQFWATLGLQHPDGHTKVVTLFGYDTVQVHDLLEAWVHGPQPIRCLIPKDTPLAQRVAQQMVCRAGLDQASKGALHVVWVPFRDQIDYDPLLWASDFNFVRGEDSFVRAQWAAHPMAWHIYPQMGHAHQIKLKAFLDRYLQGLEAGLARRYRTLFAAWNGEGSIADAWNALWPDWGKLEAHAQAWARQQADFPDLAHNLAEFVGKLL